MNRPDALLLIGPTGAGKSPLGEWGEAVGLHGRPCRHFDFGAQLREASHKSSISAKTTLTMQTVLREGRLLQPQEWFVAAEILDTFLATTHPDTGIILNGLPRDITQAREIASSVQIRFVLVLQADPVTIQNRIRLNTGGDRTGRTDDAPGFVAEKLARYQRETLPLVQFFQEADIPCQAQTVDLYTNPQAIWQRIPPLAPIC